MHRPRILDVVRAVAEAAPSYAEVAAWWYLPGSEFRLEEHGDGWAAPGRNPDAVEIVVEWVSQEAAAEERCERVAADLCERIAADLSARLGAYPVRVRVRGSFAPGRRLFRLLSTEAG